MACVRLSTLTKCRPLSTSARGAIIKNVTIVGGGQMGSGIAQCAAQTGHQVTLVDVSDDVLQRSTNTISVSLARVAKKKFADKKDGEKFILDALSRIALKTDLGQAVATADLVIEAIVEDLNMKQELFAKIDKLASRNTLFASNTSSFFIRDIAKLTSRQDRFGGMHFFNPVPVMKLVEVVRTPEESAETHESLLSFGRALEKTPIETKDTMGFVVNRLLVPFLMEAVRMLERGDATAKDIDTAMKLGAGHPMGPIELNDFCGLDINKSVIDGWHKQCPDDALFKPNALLNKLVAEGKLGTKTGEGFYSYAKRK